MKQIFTISSGKEIAAAQQVLTIRLGQHHFGFAISNPVSGELLQLTWYTTGETSIAGLDEILDAHPELKHSFYHVLVGYDYVQSTLVPQHLYRQDDARLLLETMHGVNGTHAVVAESIPGWQLQNVYAVPGAVRDWVMAQFPPAVYRHGYSIGVRLLPAAEATILVDFQTNHFSVIAGRDNKLLLTQTFAYATAADVVYHLLQVCVSFALPQERVQLVLSGLIEKESNLYRSLVQYFLQIRFREPAWQLPATTEADAPPHFFTSLNDLIVCAS